MHDIKLVKFLVVLLVLPIALSMCSGDRFRYPCQDPANWDKDICKMPICDVTRTCPEHVFKGQRDPRLGPPKEGGTPSSPTIITNIPPGTPTPKESKGANCK